jgi:hypothetical protein
MMGDNVPPSENRQAIKKSYRADSNELKRQESLAGKHCAIIGTGQNAVNLQAESGEEIQYRHS